MVSKWNSGTYLPLVPTDVWQEENRWTRKQHAIFTGKKEEIKEFFFQ
jgi:hypothetical protein